MSEEKRFYRFDDFNGWVDKILIMDRKHPLGNPEFTPSYKVAELHLTGSSEKYEQTASDYADWLVDRLNGTSR